MRYGFTLVLSVMFVFAGSAASSTSAQDFSSDIGVSAVGVQYDLSGTGTAAGLAVRATREVFGNAVLELRSLFAKPHQQSGPSMLFVPEVQIHYRWNVARVSPYIGVGGGLAAVKSPIRTDWDPTLSVSAGTALRLTERMGLIGELRLRGIEWRFTGSTAEWSIGLVWRLPSF